SNDEPPKLGQKDDHNSNQTTVAKTEVQTEENDHCYRMLLQSVINPLGAADTHPGFRPKDLASTIKQVFQIPGEKHELWLKDAESRKPSNIVLNVKVVSAKDLKPMDSNGLADPYCLLSIVSKSKSNRNSPVNSPRTSPKPKRKSRHGSLEIGDVKRTQIIKTTLCPRWNEEFELEVRDVHTQELQVYVWDSDEGSTVSEQLKQLDRPSGLKSVFRQIKQTLEFGKAVDEFMGQFKVPLRDIPATGIETWYDLYDVSKKKTSKSLGQCKLKLSLAHKQEMDQIDCAESEQCSIEDYYHIVKQMYIHVSKSLNNDKDVLPRLNQVSQRILDQFASQNHLSKFSQTLVNLSVMLEWTTNSERGIITDDIIKESSMNMEVEWLRTQLDDSDAPQRVILTDTELVMFDAAATGYIHHLIKDLNDIPSLFPPDVQHLDEFKNKLSMIVNLLNLQLWTTKETLRKDLSSLIVERLQTDVRTWTENQLTYVEVSMKDTVIPETAALIEVIDMVTIAITPAMPYVQFFNRLGIDYYRVVSFGIESKMSKRVQELMLKMDQYQMRYQKYPPNITESSKVSLRLYFTLRKLFQVVKDNINERDLFRLSLAKFHSWFTESLVFWLSTFKTEAVRRMEKALEIDRDVVQVTSLVKYSNSSVDVLSSFAKITSEWKAIDFPDPDNQVMGVTKITDTICDGARLYADKIGCILERNGYYTMNEKSQATFDVTDQLCITLNNIEHVRQYIDELPNLLEWEKVVAAMSTKHEDEAVGEQSMRTLAKLQNTAHDDVKMKSSVLLQKITDRMSVDIRKYTLLFTRGQPLKKSSIDPILDYLESNLHILYEKLMCCYYPKMLEHLWNVVLTAVHDTLQNGRRPEYYVEIENKMVMLKAYFCRASCIDISMSTYLYDNLDHRLNLNSKSSEELEQEYWAKICDSMSTPLDYLGHLAVKIGYKKETDTSISLYVKVMNAKSLPGLNRAGLSDPFVTVDLCPKTKFPHCKQERTKTVEKNLNPEFYEKFVYDNIPIGVLDEKGAVLVFSIWDRQAFFPDRFIGEVILQLSHAQPMMTQEMLDVTVVMMPVKRPREPHGPFQVLRSRTTFDKDVKTFVQQRSRVMRHQPERTDNKIKNLTGLKDWYSALKVFYCEPEDYD
ncbi:unnamed protein product, partial [Owenia fusiformis]